MEAVPAGLADFCESIYPTLVGVLTVHVGDREVARELAQDTMVRVCEHWPRVVAMEAPKAWTYRVAFNLATSRFRRGAAERRALTRVGSRPLQHVEPWDVEVMALHDALVALPARQRQVLGLRFFADLPVDEVARIMGCAPGTVKSMTSHAVEALRRKATGLRLEQFEGADHE